MIGVIVYAVLIIVVLGLLASLSYRLLHSVTVVVSITIVSLAVIIGAIGLISYNDFTDYQENLPTEQKKVLFHNNGKLLAGFSTVQYMADDTFWLSSTDINEQSQLFEEKRYDTLQDDAYVLIIVDIDALEEGSMQFQGEPITGEELNQVVAAEDSIEVFTNLITLKKGVAAENRVALKTSIINAMGTDNAALRLYVIGNLLASTLEDNGYILEEYKKGLIKVVPSSTLLYLIKLMPASLTERILLRI